MNLKKSMISVAVASLLVSGFTGCDTSTTNTSSSSATNQTTHITNPKGTVTGLVMDTNGNPLAGVKVYLANQTATTDAGGHYTFPSVSVADTSGADAANPNQVLTVTVAAPEGYLGATVSVTPAAQIDSAENNGAGSTTSGTETFVDGFIAEATTAVIPKLGATVTAVLQNPANGTFIANQEVSLDFVSSIAGIVYATPTFKATTDENGSFTITNVPEDSTLNYVVPNYNILANTTVNTGAETSVVNDAIVSVSPIMVQDTVAPFVTSTTGEIGNAAARQMLEDDVRKTIVIHFSEPMNIEVDKDYTDSVIVKTGKTAAEMTTAGATATASGSTLTVTLDNELADGELLDINLLISDFKDAAGNFVTVAAGGQTPNVGYDSVAGQVLKLKYQGYNDLNTDAQAVNDLTQQNEDTNGAVDDAALLQAANSAFKDVVDSGTPNNTIEQMNAPETNARLAALGTAALSGTPVTMVSDVARLTFTPSGAAAYDIKVTRAGAPVNLNAGDLAIQGGVNTATVAFAGGVATITPVDASSVNPMEFVINTAANLQAKDVVTITPKDDLGYAGTPTTMTIVDNVVPTTIIQHAYNVGGNGTDAGSTVVKFGDGAELSDVTGSITVGTPYLPITAGLLDNLTATGATVDGVTASDNKLTEELFAHNTVNTSVTPNAPFIPKSADVYDNTAWNTFNTDASLARTVGVAFSEDVNLSGVTPTTTAATALTNWKVNNNVTVNDDTGVVNADLIDFTAANIIALANDDNGKVIDFTGISDAAGNVAGTDANAKVVIQDKMPPMIESASFDGENVIINFNEAITLSNGDQLTIVGGVNRTATYNAANASKYVLSNNGKTLTIDPTEFAGLTKSDFALGDYAEVAYGADKHQHAALVFDDIADAHGNNWATNTNLITTPKFAMAELIGQFTHTTNATDFVGADNTTNTQQVVVWTFAHPVKNDAVGEILYGVTANANGDYVWAWATNSADITAWFEDTLGGAAESLTDGDAANHTYLKLDSTKKVLTLGFTTTSDLAVGDTVRMKAGKVIKSQYDNTQSVSGNTLSASAQ